MLAAVLVVLLILFVVGGVAVHPLFLILALVALLALVGGLR